MGMWVITSTGEMSPARMQILQAADATQANQQQTQAGQQQPKRSYSVNGWHVFSMKFIATDVTLID
jgi:hypothetical protein